MALLVLGAGPASAQLVIFETPGLTLGDDAVECTNQAGYRHCVSDAGTERVLSHDDLAAGDRIPLDFQLYLPPEPVSGPDGLYPLVVFIHGWGNSKTAPGGGLESEFVPYATDGYAVLAYNARAWNESCGFDQKFNPECEGQWNHLADIRYEVRDTQYLAGLLADELSDTGTPLVDPQRIGVTGVSYGGGQSTMLASLRNRVVDPDGTVRAWTSPAGKPMQIAAAAPFWAWTDLAYSLLPTGRTLDYVANNSYRGPGGADPFGVMKESYVSGLFAVGATSSVYAPMGEDPDLNAWFALINLGEPYTEPNLGPIADAVTTWRSGHDWISLATEPAPILFNSGWSDDIFPVSEPVRYIQRARQIHPTLAAKLVVSDYGHARANGVDAGYAKSSSRAWFDHYLLGIGPEPGPAVRARTQGCPAGSGTDYSAAGWLELSPGELRLQNPSGGTVLSSAGPSSASANAFDPIAPPDDPCTRVADELVAGTVVVDFPSPDPGGYTVLGSPTIIADMTVTGSAPDSMLAVRLLDVDPAGDEQLLARGVYRPDASGRHVFQLAPMGFHVADDHHLQLEFMGHEAPTTRPSNISFTIALANLDLRIPVAEAPDGQQIQAPAPPVLPPGYVLARIPPIPALSPWAVPALALGLVWAARRRLGRRP